MIEVEIGVGEGSEEEILADEVLAKEAQADGKCTTLHVPSAVKIVKSRFGQARIDRYTAVTVLNKGEMKTEIPGNQGEEASAGQILKTEGHIWVVVTEEMLAVEIADNLWIN